jgi:hypothetical protein
MTVTVIVAEWVALPPTAAAVAVTLDVPSGTLGPAGVGLELEPQPATPRKNRAITSMCIHRGRSQREIPVMEFLLRLAIEVRLCQDVIGQVRALPSKDSTTSIFLASWDQE